MAACRAIDIPIGHKKIKVVITEDDELELWFDGCLRKRREPSGRDPLYVWTNVELYWEEHAYVEVRYFRCTRELKVTVNGEVTYEG
jgi:hypothetical protein